jgi:sulfur carrier protein
MKIFINGQEQEVEENITVDELIEFLKIRERTMATAVNMKIVKEWDWIGYTLNDGDKIEFLQFVGGG